MSTPPHSSRLITYHVSYQDLVPATGETLLTVKEVAARLAIGRTTVYELIASGELPALRIGRVRRIPSSAVQRFIEQRMEGE